MIKTISPLICAAFLTISSSAIAGLIDFSSSLPNGEIRNDFSIGGFNFIIDSNYDGFENLNRTGTGTIESSGGISSLFIEASNGGDFEFNSLVAMNYGSSGAQMYWGGWHNGVKVISTPSPFLSDTAFTVLQAFPGRSIDRLQLVFGPSPSQDEVISGINLTHSAATNVPEPTTLAIFALAMMGLASRRFKKQS